MILFRSIGAIYILVGFISSYVFAQSLNFLELSLYILFYTYIVPPSLCRLTGFLLFKKLNLRNVVSNRSYPTDKTFSFWWVTTQLQLPFSRFEFLEEFLRMFPEIYSAWLRLWGAKIGSNVIWPPGVCVIDRPFIEIGNEVLVGAYTKMTSHFVNRLSNEHKAELFLATISIGSGATVGGAANLYPGCQVKDNELIPPASHVKNGIFYTKEKS